MENAHPRRAKVIRKSQASLFLAERTDFLGGDAPTAREVEAFLANALAASGPDAPTAAGALVPWIRDVLLSNHSVKTQGRVVGPCCPIRAGIGRRILLALLITPVP